MIAKQVVNLYSKNIFSQEVLDDYLDLFHGTKKFHMSRYMYNCASKVDWYKIISNKSYYYPTSHDRDLLSSFTKSDFINNFANCKFFEIGPGIVDSLTSKTISLVSFINPKSYIAIDLNEYYAKGAASSVNRLTNLPTEHIVCDAFKELPTLSSNSKNLLVVAGNTIGNLTEVELHNFFRSTNQSLNKGDGLLVTLDYMNDQNKLAKAYNNYYTYQLLLNIMRNLLIQNFNSEAFKMKYMFNTAKSTVELSLISLENQLLAIPGHPIKVIKGQKFDLVISRKFNSKLLRDLALRYNFKISVNYALKDNPMHLSILTKV